MDAPALLDALFPEGHQTTISDSLITGTGTLGGQTIEVLGTTNHAYVGGTEALFFADRFLDVAEKNPGRPILMLVDNNGQRMALDEELLVLPEYVAHLLKAQQFAREAGSKIIAVLYGPAIAGGFIAFGMLADRIVAVPGAEPSVMKLEAIARVTKMPLDQLEELAKKISVFSPGCDSFFQMGGVYEIWNDDFANHLASLLGTDVSKDLRAVIGKERGGRKCAADVIRDVLAA